MAKAKDLLWGAVNHDMELTIPYMFQWLGNFSEHLAMFKSGGRIGFCDAQGKVVIPAKFTGTNIFRQGFAPASTGQLYGYVDYSGRFAIPEKFDFAEPFNEGKACVCFGQKYGYIRPDGTWLRLPELDHGSSFSEGFAAVRLGDTFFFIDENGNHVGPEFEDECGDFSSGRALCKRNGRSIVVNHKFELLSIFPEFQWASLSSQVDVMTIKQSGKYGFAGLNGTILLEPSYTDATSFFEGKAAVKKGTKWAIVEFTGKIILQVTDFSFDEISLFKEGSAVCRLGNEVKFISSNGTISYESFSLAQPYCSGLASVRALQ